MDPRNFFADLKRRNVYQIAVAYAVVGWLIMQIAATVVPALHLSDTITSAVVLLTLLGFPIALVFAWAFELTPEGIKRAEDLGRRSQRLSKSRSWIFVVTIAGAMSVGLFFLGRHTVAPRQASLGETAGKSIAVLPFQNLSGEKENAYFTDGVQDEILTTRAKVADLKVISARA